MNGSEGKENADRNTQVCPFLGLSDDPETALSFPSPHNRCYHAKQALSVNLEFQRSYCLVANHISCEEYNSDAANPLPPNSRNGDTDTRKKSIFPGVLIVFLAFAVVALVFWQVLPHFFSGWGLSKHLPEVSLPVNSTVVAMQTPSILPTKAQDTPTPTILVMNVPAIPSQTFTATTRSPHVLETPIGVEYKLVIHRVVAGESIMSIASQYWTTVEAIHAVNYSIPNPLLIGTLIIIPINQTDVHGLPAFGVYEVKTDISVRALAQQLSIDPALLELYNGLGNSESLSSGDWVLVPHK